LFDQNRAGLVVGLVLAFLAVIATACSWAGLSVKDLLAMMPHVP
jgi:hypothetical protein